MIKYVVGAILVIGICSGNWVIVLEGSFFLSVFFDNLSLNNR